MTVGPTPAPDGGVRSATADPRVPENLLGAVLDAWDRGTTILTRLLRALPPGGLEARVLPGSPTVAAQFTHVRDVRLFFVSQTAPDVAGVPPDLFRSEGDGWTAERDADRVAALLADSARAVREAVRRRVAAGEALRGAHVAYDHPVLLLQHLLWHEGYHVGQIMLALKAAGRPLSDGEAEAALWGVWRREW